VVANKDIERIVCEIKQNTSSLLPEADLIKKLETGKKLKIKFGADPTAPDLHLGHTVILSKLRQFQEMGHEIIFLIGDFTARIGDPTGRSKTRPPLTKGQIEYNTATYFEQVARVLDPSKMTVKYNSEWLDKLNGDDIVRFCAKLTLAKLTEREDFATRIKDHVSIGFHELLYPIFQAYDSVVLEADIELGGTDQTFNLLLGRHLQEQFGQKPQVILTMPLLEGLDEVKKMSKSLGNAVGLNEKPNEVFGKLMSISDKLMWRYLELLLNTSSSEISQMQERVAAGNLNPMGIKKDMAHDIIAKFWSLDEAIVAKNAFESVFQKKDYSKVSEVELSEDILNPIWVVELLKFLGAVKTSSEAKRLIEGGAVSIDEIRIENFKAEVQWKSGMLIKVGKHRLYRIK